jgi:2-keto-4-pentenoate hydratase
MKKLSLDSLAVDSFDTVAERAAHPGTVVGQQQRSLGPCPESWNGTCYVTCPIADTEGC